MKTNDSPDVITARKILRGATSTTKEKIVLYDKLKGAREFRYARKLLALLRKSQPCDLLLCQQHAICTYKDPNLPGYEKFDRAINILKEVEDIELTVNQETLGILGAIYKRKWEFENQIQDLDRSHHFYQKGYQQWAGLIKLGKKQKHDNGYTAINAAFVSDLLAYVTTDVQQQEAAKKIREDIVEKLENKSHKKYWIAVTLGEAHFGLGNYEKAKDYLEKARSPSMEPPMKSWEYESTARQLAMLADLQINKFSTKPSEAEVGEQLEILMRLEQNNDPDEKKMKELRTEAKEILKQKKQEDARKALEGFLDDPDGVNNAFEGKLGLALSGGGFRASFFHIGVLARLAELDKLKDIEVLSCVSGGSILGAYYYLKLMLLLEKEPDSKIEKDDYIKIVKDIEKEFLAGVQKNLRVKLLGNLWGNFKLLFRAESRTTRMAKLYESELYKTLWDDILDQRKKASESHSGNDDEQEKTTGVVPDEKDHISGMIPLRELEIKPKKQKRAEQGQAEKKEGKEKEEQQAEEEGQEKQEGGEKNEEFNYKIDNWKRKNKVPNLILNSTTLNTGHNWQFTASWMGEPPGSIVSEVDAKYRLRRMYYYEAPSAFQNFSLGEAVAASAGVPGIFDPIVLEGLYPGVKVQLVDGGVHDNQGIAGLIEQGSNQLFISDASGQVGSVDGQGNSAINALLRTNEVSQERLRETQYLNLLSREKSGLIKKLVFLHLKKDINERPKDWVDCKDRVEVYGSEKSFEDDKIMTTGYGIEKRTQELLSQVRTDLDAFHNAEAYALMYSGYMMMKSMYDTKEEINDQKEVNKQAPKQDKEIVQQPEWEFLKIRDYMEGIKKNSQLNELLSVSSKNVFKLFHLDPYLRYAFLVLGGIFLICLIPFMAFFWDRSILALSRLVYLAIYFVILVSIGKFIASILNLKGTAIKMISKAFLAIIGTAASGLYLFIFNRYYLKYGEFDPDRDLKPIFKPRRWVIAGPIAIGVGLSILMFTYIGFFSKFLAENYPGVENMKPHFLGSAILLLVLGGIIVLIGKKFPKQ